MWSLYLPNCNHSWYNFIDGMAMCLFYIMWWHKGRNISSFFLCEWKFLLVTYFFHNWFKISHSYLYHNFTTITKKKMLRYIHPYQNYPPIKIIFPLMKTQKSRCKYFSFYALKVNFRAYFSSNFTVEKYTGPKIEIVIFSRPGKILIFRKKRWHPCNWNLRNWTLIPPLACI